MYDASQPFPPKPDRPEFPKTPPVDWTGVNETFDKINSLKDNVTDSLNNPTNPEVQKAKDFFNRNRPIIVTVAACFVVYKVEKRMVRKVVTKAIRNDTGIVKEHLNQLTVAMEDLVMFAHDKRFGNDTFLRGVTDSINNGR